MNAERVSVGDPFSDQVAAAAAVLILGRYFIIT